MKSTPDFLLMCAIAFILAPIAQASVPNYRGRGSPNEVLADLGNESGVRPVSAEEVTRNLVMVAEDIAEVTAKQCHAAGIPIDYETLKREQIDCLMTKVAMIQGAFTQISTSFQLRQGEESELDRIREKVLIRQQPLTAHQKQTLKRTVLSPFCSALTRSTSECTKPEYGTLVQAQKCKPDFERILEELERQFVGDLCRDDGAWLFEYFDTRPMRCVGAYLTALESDRWLQCVKFFEQYKQDKSNPGKAKRVESREEMCKFTGLLGLCTSHLLVNSCDDYPEPGTVIMNTFKSTQKLWHDRCVVGLAAAGGALPLVRAPAIVLLMLNAFICVYNFIK